MPTEAFEDDYAIDAGKGDGGTSAMELTERELAIAQGRDPEAGAEPTDGTEEEAEDKDVEGRDDAASDDEGKDAPGSDWINDEVQDWADSYGIDDSTLESFESEADFKRFARIYEQSLAKLSVEEKSAEKPKSKAKEPRESVAEDSDDDSIDVQSFEKDGYDEATLKVVKVVAKLQGSLKSLAAKNEELERRLADGDAQRELEAVHRDIDTLGGRFGKSDSLTRRQRKDREKLIDAVEVVKQSLERRGEKASTAVMLKRAELVAFGDEILAEEKAKQKEDLVRSAKKQSAKRRSVGRNTKPARKGRPGEAVDPVKAIAAATADWWRENVEE